MRILAALIAMLIAHATAIADQSFTRTEARDTIADLAAKLEAGYLDPAIGARYAAALRGKLQAGGYDNFPSPESFADAVSADLRAVHADGHLRLRVTDATAQSQGHPRPQIVPFDPPKRIAPDVAYAKWRIFTGGDDSVAAARHMVEDFAKAKAVIFDMREHHGGGLAEPDLFFSKLFGAPTHLVTMRIRDGRGGQMASMFDALPTMRRQPQDNGVNVWEHWSKPEGPQTAWASIPVYVLTSKATASAAEHFTLALKITGRAILVGEVTRGAGNFGGNEPIGKRFSAFIAVGQTIDPKTGKGWDEIGITPDIATPAVAALDRALAEIRLRLATADR